MSIAETLRGYSQRDISVTEGYLKGLSGVVPWYGGRRVVMQGSKDSISFSELYKHILANPKFATIEVLNEVHRLEEGAITTSRFAKFGTWWRRLPDKISNFFKNLFSKPIFDKAAAKDLVYGIMAKNRVEAAAKKDICDAKPLSFLKEVFQISSKQLIGNPFAVKKIVQLFPQDNPYLLNFLFDAIEGESDVKYSQYYSTAMMMNLTGEIETERSARPHPVVCFMMGRIYEFAVKSGKQRSEDEKKNWEETVYKNYQLASDLGNSSASIALADHYLEKSQSNENCRNQFVKYARAALLQHDVFALRYLANNDLYRIRKDFDADIEIHPAVIEIFLNNSDAGGSLDKEIAIELMINAIRGEWPVANKALAYLDQLPAQNSRIPFKMELGMFFKDKYYRTRNEEYRIRAISFFKHERDRPHSENVASCNHNIEELERIIQVK